MYCISQLKHNTQVVTLISPVKELIRHKSSIPSVEGVSTFSASRASNRRLTFFFHGGGKEKLESHFRQLVIKRALKKAAQTTGGSPALYDLFVPFYLSATPFVGLKSRRKRRGKRVIHKLIPLDRARSERKPFLVLSSILRTSGRVSKSFNSRLSHELDSLYTASRSQGSVSILREKRDAVHRTAFASRPYRWKPKTAVRNKKRERKVRW